MATGQQIIVNNIKAQSMRAPKVKSMTGDFGDALLGAANAFGGVASTANSLYGNNIGATALMSAFSGMQAAGGSMAGGGMASGANYAWGGGMSTPYMSAGFGGGLKSQTVSGADQSLFPGTDGTGVTQADLINTMNDNSLKLLELQAQMQSFMQQFNTKSNILSADHHARMSRIEKLTTR